MALTIESRYNLHGGIESLIGGRQENQDAAGFRDTPLGAIIVVCDGMGGGPGGATASHLGVQTIIDDVAKAKYYEVPQDVLRNAILHANQVILQAGNDNPDLKGMGTTVTAVIINTDSATVAHMGDSRVYMLRGRSKVFRTFDHSHVFTLVAAGQYTEEQARKAPNSNVILKALGIQDGLQPDICQMAYNAGDRFLLCTDGFWGAMPEGDLLRQITQKGPLLSNLDDLASDIDKIGKSKGGHHDNLTAAYIEVTKNSKLKPKMRKSLKIILAVLGISLLLSLLINFFTVRYINQNNQTTIMEVLYGHHNPSDSTSVSESRTVNQSE